MIHYLLHPFSKYSALWKIANVLMTLVNIVFHIFALVLWV